MKKPKLHPKLRKIVPGKVQQENTDELNGLPRITNETVAEHREEVLSTARKYIYPLQHSRHRIVVISIALVVVAIIAFFTYTLLALYKFNASSGFMHGITRVFPFPVAKAGSSFVSYDDYLFELRRLMHYYQTQQNVDFSSKDGQDLLALLRTRALDTVIENAHIKQLAEKNNVSVSRAEVDAQIALLKSQNRLGASDQVFEDVLQEFWGWSVDDFRRVLRQQILAQKVALQLDKGARSTANTVHERAVAGEDFAALAKQFSQAPGAQETGGSYGFPIDRTTKDIEPQVLDNLLKLTPGQISNVIETSAGFEIVKVLEKSADGKIQAAHILIAVEPPTNRAKALEEQSRTWRFISS